MSDGREEILDVLAEIFRRISEWELSEPITPESRFSTDLGFQSIDAVVLGEAIEAHYQRRFPYSEFLAGIVERQQPDITVGELVDFIYGQIHAAQTVAEDNPER